MDRQSKPHPGLKRSRNTGRQHIRTTGRDGENHLSRRIDGGCRSAFWTGDKITELGDKAKDAFLETQDATVKASTYFGETGKAAEETAGVIKDVYAEGVGDSMDSVSNAVITVKKNLKDLDETTLTHLTEQAITLDELYGIDMNETLRGVNSLMEQYGLTAQQANGLYRKGYTEWPG